MAWFKYNSRKAIAASTQLIAREDDLISIPNFLLKLYLADRRFIQLNRSSITGDEIVTTPFGPVPKRIHNMIYYGTIVHPDDQFHKLLKISQQFDNLYIEGYKFDIGIGPLCESEIDCLEEISEINNPQKIIRFFPEFGADIESTSLFHFLGYSLIDIVELESEINTDRYLDKVFAGVA